MKTDSRVFILSTIIGLGLVWFMVWPKAQNIDELRSTVFQQREDLNVLNQTENSIRSSTDFYSGLPDTDIKLVELAVPVYPDKINITNILNAIAEQNGMTVNKITTEAQVIKQEDSFSTVNVSVQLEGSYSSFQEFVKSAEGILRIFDITKIEITSNIEQDLSVFNVSGKVYYLR